MPLALLALTPSAFVTGVPLGTYIGQTFGWQATFLTVAILSSAQRNAKKRIRLRI